MEAREELKKLKTLAKVIEIIKGEIVVQRLDIERPRGTRYDRQRVQSTPEDHLAERIEAIAKKERELKAILLDSELQRKKIIARICRLKDPRHIDILTKVYVEFKSIDQAAEEMGYSIDHAKRLHSAAVSEYENRTKT